MRTLYKKDSSGKIRFLTISTDAGFLIQESGVVGTTSPVRNISVCEAKNVGRANATTPEEQAIAEAASKITEKLRLGYFDTMEEAEEKGGADFLLPMLAKDYAKEKKKVKYPCFAQPKLDGMRALGVDESFMSRTGKAIDTINHIDLSNLEHILDGELYAHGISFQENMKLLKKYTPGKTEEIKYHVYDIVSDLPFEDRYELLKSAVEGRNDIHLVPTVVVNSDDELQDYHSKNITDGYEGTIIRHGKDGYAVNKRSGSLLKKKDFLDEVYKVIDVVPSESRPEQGVIVCTSDKGDFNTGMKFSHEARQEILTNKENYIGQMAEIRFFEYTDGGLPRFPVCYGFRLDK